MNVEPTVFDTSEMQECRNAGNPRNWRNVVAKYICTYQTRHPLAEPQKYGWLKF